MTVSTSHIHVTAQDTLLCVGDSQAHWGSSCLVMQHEAMLHLGRWHCKVVVWLVPLCQGIERELAHLRGSSMLSADSAVLLESEEGPRLTQVCCCIMLPEIVAAGPACRYEAPELVLTMRSSYSF